VERWQYANDRHDWLMYGLPLDNKVLNEHGQPLAEIIGDPSEPGQTLKDLFPQNPVNTQVMEVERVQQKVFGPELQKVDTDKAKHLVLLCRYLLPLATSFEERERLILIRVNLADEEKAKALKTALQQGFQRALASLKKEEEELKLLADPVEVSKRKRPFEQHYLDAVQLQGGPDKRPIVKEFLALLPRGGGKPFAEAAGKPDDAGFLRDVRNDQQKTFQELFDAAYDELLRSLDDDLKKRWEDHFAAAKAGIVRPRKPGDSPRELLTPLEQKKAVARLLFNLVEVTPGVVASPPKQLWDDPAYKRVINVVGLKVLRPEVEGQARLYQSLAEDVKSAIGRDHNDFAVVHRDLLEQIKDRASRVAVQSAVVQRYQDMVTEKDKIVVRRKVDVDYYVKELDKVRKETAARLAELSQMEAELFKIRVQVRDATRLNQEYQRQLNALEDRVR